MREVVKEAIQRFGTVNGVIHSAGIAGDGVIQRKTVETARAVLAPKIEGTVILDHLLTNENGIQLDFFVMCSSLASVFESFGQVDYSAANAFLDAYAFYLRDRGVPAFSINWEVWKEIGMVTKLKELPTWEEVRVLEFETFGMSPSEGVEIFKRIISSQQPQALVSTFDLGLRIEQTRDSGSDIFNDLPEDIVVSRSSHERPDLNNPYIEPRNPLERTIADIWQNLLGIDKVGIFDSFFDLGGDSLLATRVLSSVHEACDVELQMYIIFERPTVAGLAEFIELSRKENLNPNQNNAQNSMQKTTGETVSTSAEPPAGGNRVEGEL
jgi:acyl carrier protein